MRSVRQAIYDTLILLIAKVRYSYPLFHLCYYATKTLEYQATLARVMDYVAVNQLGGDYLEFGVYEGSTLTCAYHSAQRKHLKNMRLYAFDSFEGLPELVGIDSTDYGFSKGDFACSEGKFRERIKRLGVDPNKVIITKGWYDDTLNDNTKVRLNIKSAAVIWVDCDLYQSTVSVLDFIADYVVDGTVIVFDDWFLFRGSPDRGEQRAFREWLRKHYEIEAIPYLNYSWCGQSFILHRK